MKKEVKKEVKGRRRLVSGEKRNGEIKCPITRGEGSILRFT